MAVSLLCEAFQQLFRALIVSVLNCIIFTARRYAKRGICRRCVSVCVCVSMTLQYCIKRAKRRITLMPHNTTGTLVF